MLNFNIIFPSNSIDVAERHIIFLYLYLVIWQINVYIYYEEK